MNIIIRTDASVSAGTGHVFRCLTLADELRRNGASTEFVCRKEKGNLNKFIADKGYKVHSLPEGIGPGTDRELTRKILEDFGEKPDWLVVDHYKIDISWESNLKEYVRKIMVIDDLACRQHYCNIFLDQNYGADESLCKKLLPGHCIRLLGPEYTLLRPQFPEMRANLRRDRSVVKKILVFMGGVDQSNETCKALRAVQMLNRPDIYTDVVIGAENPHTYDIKSLAVQISGTKCFTGVENMAELMASADLGIGACGTSTWERCCAGLPGIVIVLAGNQTKIAEAMEKKEAVLNLGWYENVSENSIKTALEDLIENSARRESMSIKGREMVDGNGAGRVVKVLKRPGRTTMKVLFLGADASRQLSEWLRAQGEEVFFTDKKIDKESVVKYNPDIIISYNYRYIIKNDILSIPGRGAFNLHVSYLPWNKGAFPNVWSILENTPNGVTIHRIDNGIDTGDILLQKEVFFDESRETLKTSYEKLHMEIQKMFKENWEEVKEGKIEPKKQAQGGTLHYKKDSQQFAPFIQEKGWDTPVSVLMGRLATSG